MTGYGGTEGRCFRDLPDDLLGAIYRHCFSPYDRARFAAVCRSWRAAASWQPKLPALPLLINSTGNGRLDWKTRAYSPEDGRVLNARLPLFPYGKRIVGSHDGGWVAAAFGCRVEIVNLFTRAMVATTERIVCRESYVSGKISIEKVVFSDDPTSESCILAAITTRGMLELYRLGFPDARWIGWGTYTRFLDIAFCNGELYGISCSHELLNLLIGRNKYNAELVISIKDLTIQRPNNFEHRYIFELRGKLATVVKVGPGGSSKAQDFRVYELSKTSQSNRYDWIEVTSLGDHALFIGQGCCKAVHVSAVGIHGEVEANRIYYSKQHDQLPDGVDPECLAILDLGSCALYSYENEGMHHLDRIISRGYHYRENHNGIVRGRSTCTWILPPHF